MKDEGEGQDLLASVAIIGLSGRFPGAKNLTELWRNICDGVESVSFFSDEELLSSGIDPALLNNPNFVKSGAVLDDIESFDARFFGIAPREAESMDPQQRLFIECAWHALEDAGYDPVTYAGRIGVYAGTGASTYLRQVESSQEFVALVGGYQIALGNDKDFLTTHVSYKLNLRGPSIVVQSACSTSLSAVHVACQSLLDHQCDIALAGGVSIRTPQTMGYFYQEEGIFSPDGHCRPFDAKAQGLFSGNGLGIVVLKRFADALADGDCVHAVIRGSAMNNDGSLKVGYTAPSVDGQAQVITTAQTIAGVHPETITYVETHGTATPIGDPIEIAALTQAFRLGTDKKNFCAIGSIKSNFGHLDSAAGVAGLIKAVLALKHKLLPPSLNFERPNPAIDFPNSPFYVNTKLSEWKKGPTARRAGVSSFGVGGTNVHVVLEEAPDRESSKSPRSCQLVLLSAKSSSALDTATTNLVEHLKRNGDVDLADVAYTLQVGRTAFSHRRMLVSESLEDVVASLEKLDPDRVISEEVSKHGSIAFLFPGHGSEYVNMGLDEYRTEPTFRKLIDLCSEILMPHLGLDLRHVLYPEPDQVEEAVRQLGDAAVFQPALLAVDYALAKLWMEWGIRPDAMIGHSSGEYAAACVAGVFSLEDGLALIAERGNLMERTPKGTMVAVPLSENDVRALLGDGLSLAAVNGPSVCVVSGSSEAVDEFENRLAARGEECRRLQSCHAYHSMFMEPVVMPLLEEVKKLSLSAPAIPFLSNVTGTWVTSEQATDPTYWATHLCHTVRFSQGIQLLLQEPGRILLEVGPGGTLARLASAHIRRAAGQRVFSSLHRSQDEKSDRSSLLQTLGWLWLSGIQVNWSGFYAHDRRHRLSLPPYPFERRRYWVETKPARREAGSRNGSLLRTPEIADWFYIPSWKRTMAYAPFKAEKCERQKSCWMILADHSGLAQDMVKCLEEAGQTVVTVIKGKSYCTLSNSTYVINPADRTDYDSLFCSLKASGIEPDRIVHCWSITADGSSQSDASVFEEFQVNGFQSLLFLAQALEKTRATHKVDLVVVSNHLLAASPEEGACPEKATLLGACQVVPQEYTRITCRCVDIVLSRQGSRRQERLMKQLLSEIAETSSDSVIAYRGNHRLVRSYERAPLQRSADPVRKLREQGVYLLTGGLGNVGLRVAEHLAQSVRAKLILVGRSAFPERSGWDKWLNTHPDQDNVSSKIRKISRLEELGAEVVVVSADIADGKEMQRILTLIHERFGEINGVFHLAADTRPDIVSCPISNVDEQTCAFQFRPKVYGTYALARALQGANLDFCILFSSNASILGGLGLAAYSAANHFLDSFVNTQNEDGSVAWISTNWDGWPREGAGHGPRQGPMKGSMDEYVMDGRESVEALDLIVSRATAEQVVVSPGDLFARLDVWIRREFLQGGEDAEQTPMHARPSVQTAYAPPVNETEQVIVDIWQKLLGVDRVGINDNFLELGGHSLLAMQLISRLRQMFQLEVPVRTIFDSPTPAALAEAIRTLKGVGKASSPVITPVPRERRRITFTEQEYKAKKSEMPM